MARLINVIHGEMRGSIAGNTYSRNKSGMIVRYKATPTQPNNAGQVQARANFGASAVGFSNLTATERQSWNEFSAVNGGFVPLRKMNQGQFSGVNAFAALRSTLLSASQKLQTPVLEAVGMPQPTLSLVDFVYSNTAPTAGFTPSVIVQGSGPGSTDYSTFLSVDEVIPDVQAENILLRFNCNPSGLAGSLLGLSSELGMDYSSFGFMVYISESMKSANMRSKNKFANCLVACRPIMFSAAVTATALSQIDITLPIVLPVGKTKLVAGRFNDFTIVAISPTGQLSVIGTVNEEVPIPT